MDDVWHNANAAILDRSGTVFSYMRERNNNVYYVVVYILLGKFKVYIPNVMA
jgi:hypothetical protein